MIRALLIALALTVTPVRAETLRLAATTSFNNSGLSDVLLPAIAQDIDLDVQLLVVGTGQALRLGQSGDVDAILVHSKAAELEFVAAGYASHRREIMYNDFVLIGPSEYPAQVRAAATATEALQRIAKAQLTFVSRGDDSGTHRKELALWAAALLVGGLDGRRATAFTLVLTAAFLVRPILLPTVALVWLIGVESIRPRRRMLQGVALGLAAIVVAVLVMVRLEGGLAAFVEPFVRHGDFHVARLHRNTRIFAEIGLIKGVGWLAAAAVLTGVAFDHYRV